MQAKPHFRATPEIFRSRSYVVRSERADEGDDMGWVVGGAFLVVAAMGVFAVLSDTKARERAQAWASSRGGAGGGSSNSVSVPSSRGPVTITWQSGDELTSSLTTFSLRVPCDLVAERVAVSKVLEGTSAPSLAADSSLQSILARLPKSWLGTDAPSRADRKRSWAGSSLFVEVAGNRLTDRQLSDGVAAVTRLAELRCPQTSS
jgi:hypothetical protein